MKYIMNMVLGQYGNFREELYTLNQYNRIGQSNLIENYNTEPGPFSNFGVGVFVITDTAISEEDLTFLTIKYKLTDISCYHEYE
jgi:hypothetical protein